MNLNPSYSLTLSLPWVAYVRVAGDWQDAPNRQGYARVRVPTLAEQEWGCLEWARERGVVFRRVYRDVAMAPVFEHEVGRVLFEKDRRPAGAWEILKGIKGVARESRDGGKGGEMRSRPPLIGGLVVWRLDRLFSRLNDGLIWRDLCRKRGVRLISVDDGLGDDDQVDARWWSCLEAVAAWDQDRLEVSRGESKLERLREANERNDLESEDGRKTVEMMRGWLIAGHSPRRVAELLRIHGRFDRVGRAYDVAKIREIGADIIGETLDEMRERHVEEWRNRNK